MAVKTVPQNTANAQRGTLAYELARVVNQLQAAVEELKTDYNAAVALINELKADFNGHTHRADGAQAGAYNTSGPQSDAETLAPVTAVTVGAADADTIAAATPDSITFRETGTPA